MTATRSQDILARVPRNRIRAKEAYGWFAGRDEEGHPRWTGDLKARVHAFEDRNGIKVVSVSCPPVLRRYLLLYNPRDNRGHFALVFNTGDDAWNTVQGRLILR